MGEAIKCLIGGWTHKQYYLREREWQIIAAMADCSHGQLRSLTRLSSCNPKLVWRGGKGLSHLTIMSAVGGGLRSLRSVCKETEKPSAPPKTTSSSFSPVICVLLNCVSLAISLWAEFHCSLISIWQYICALVCANSVCFYSVYEIVSF